VLAAIDFTTIEVWTRNGLVTFYLLFAMELRTRRVHCAGALHNTGSILVVLPNQQYAMSR
jgi:hypothetical protein